jgi:replicative DNA helicase
MHPINCKMSVSDVYKLLFDSEAEAGFLGAVIRDNSILTELETIQPEHFFSDGHSRVYALMRAIAGSGHVADVKALTKGLGTNHETYLTKLLVRAPQDNEQALSNAALIRELATSREMLETVVAAAKEQSWRRSEDQIPF